MLHLRKVATTLLAFIAVFTANAYKITGSVSDDNGEPLPDATARLLTAPDSSFVKGTLTDDNGLFTFSGVKSGKYILETTYVGYTTTHTDVNVAKADVKLPPIKMSETSHMLSEAVITAVKTPIKVMEDTIEYNADSYKTQPNAVVEDLLKRLPGVEVDADGKITSNGKEVTKILIDGKEFFADDPKVASKNLPVNMVDKLQVVDRKSDLARLTGVDDGEDETVINLTVKKGMQNGWFGTVEGGYGTDKRYKATFNVNRFWDGNQITFIGNANNTNELGFTDGNGNRFRRFGGDQGINNSQTFGVNFNVGNGEILRVGGDIMYSHTDRVATKRQNRQYLLEENSYYENSLNDSRDRGNNVRADFRLEWKPDSFNTLDIRPFFSYNYNHSDVDNFSVTENRTTSLNRATNRGRSYEGGGRVIFNHNFASYRGRSISAFANFRMSNVREYQESYVYNLFHQLKDQAGQDSIQYYDQYNDNHTWNNNLSGRITWTEPIGNVLNGNFITIGYNVQMRWNNADKLVYNRDDITLNYENELLWHYMINDVDYTVPSATINYDSAVLNDTLSNRFRNTTLQHEISLGYKKVSSKYTLSAGLNVMPLRSKSNNLSNPDKSIPARLVWNVSPFLRFRYKFSGVTSLNVDYRARSRQPSMTQLQPVADYSDPLNVVQGNPSLVPAYNHNIRVRYQTFNSDSQRSIMAMMFADITANSIVSKTVFDNTTGGRHTTYENVNGVWNARAMTMFSQPLRNKVFSFNNNIFATFSRAVGYNNGDLNVSRTFGFNESFSFAFRPDNLELELRPYYRLQTTSNSASSIATSTVHHFGGTFNGTWYTPIGLVLATDLTFNTTTGYAKGYDNTSWMWNASLSYQFLKAKQATIALKVYDILQMKSDINRTVTATYIDNTAYNALTRYFMLSFTYRFNTFGGGAVPESRNMHGGPGGFGGPGGRPPRH